MNTDTIMKLSDACRLILHAGLTERKYNEEKRNNETQHDVPPLHLEPQAPLPKHNPLEHFCEAIESMACDLNI